MKEKFKQAYEAYEQLQLFNELTEDGELLDTRYNEPKGKPRASKEVIDAVIDTNEIYLRSRYAIKQYADKHLVDILLDAQREQVGYGIDKYPEPLNKDSWTIEETLEHIISEGIDRLHYENMLILKVKKEMPFRDNIFHIGMLERTLADNIKSLVWHANLLSIIRLKEEVR